MYSNEHRARREANEARRTRERLEKQGSSGARFPMAKLLGLMAAADTLATRPVESSLNGMRKAAEIVNGVRDGRVRDADGEIRGGSRDHWGTGAVRDAEEILSLEDMARMNRQRHLSKFF